MVRSIVIPKDGGGEPSVCELAGISEFQDVVGGWLESVDVDALGVTLYMNEAIGRRHGPINSRATTLSWYFSSGASVRQFILGDVVVAGVDDGSTGSDVPDEVVGMLLNRHRFVVQGHPERDGSWLDTFARFDNLFDAAMWCMLLAESSRSAKAFRIHVEASGSRPADSRLLGGEQPW